MDIVNPFGFVAGRWAFATADTAGDPDRGPDYIPASGASITFTPETPRQVVPDSPGWTGVINKRVVGKLNEEGRLVDAEGHNHFALGVGAYAVHYYFGNGIKWPSHRIQVTEAHTASNPLWLPPMPAPPPVPGAVNRTIQVPAGGTDGQVLVWDGAGFSWDFPPEGPEGPPGEVTTAALTTALAGKVTGTGMTVRRDTTVGERVLLDHPGGTTLLRGDTGWRNVSGSLENGWTGTLHIRRQDSNILMRATALSGSDATSNVVYTLPTGMIDGTWRSVPVYDPVKDKILNLNFYPNQLQLAVRPEAYFPAGYVQIDVARMSPTQPWPTTIPGLPA